MIRIGIICPSEIAIRRFLPALNKAKDKFEFIGVAIATPEEWFGDLTDISQAQIDELHEREYCKAINFGGKIFEGYENILKSDMIDAIYIPLPPSLHYKWAKIALQNGKHVFVEKPSTTSLLHTEELIKIAVENNLALHENYMFVFHDQINRINDIIATGEIGDVRLYRLTFGFPMRHDTDFRYNKKLGGGALLDAGGYCLKYANILLGGNAKIVAAQSNYIKGFEVDFFGSATLVNEKGETVQLAFGMDNDYRCDLEIWGSKGTITTNRIFTAPVQFTPTYTIKKNQSIEINVLPEDDSFYKSILMFENCINNESKRNYNYKIIYNQSKLVEEFINRQNNIR